MKVKLMIVVNIFFSAFIFGQTTDTLTFFSNVFQQERTVYVQTPEFYKYQSKEVELPVIYIIDGQHEWFVNPLISSIKYLQYTHEIPQALLVIVPLTERNKECRINFQEELPLHTFITEELNEPLEQYYAGDYRMIIGHSFSASFSLYSYLKAPNYYSSVISNTPLDQFEKLILELEKNQQTEYNNISISIGGISNEKDYYHRLEYDKLKLKYPDFFNSINVFEANYSAHNAVPIVAVPHLLSKTFDDFSKRYSNIAVVNEEYKLIDLPESLDQEINRIEKESRLGDFKYVPEIAEINGLASRYLSSNLNEYGIAVYEMGTNLYPNYYEFHLALYELYLTKNSEKSRYHLNKAAELIRLFEMGLPESQDLLLEIKVVLDKNGW